LASALVTQAAVAQNVVEPFAANAIEPAESTPRQQPLPLGRRTNPDREAAADRRRGDGNNLDEHAAQPEAANRWQQITRQPWVPVAGSLALVLTLFFALMAVLRRGMPAQGGKLPAAVLEVLGQATLGGKQQLHLLRCGDKLLLCCTTATGMQTLTEICEPAEVERLSALCRGGEKSRTRVTPKKLTSEFGSEFGQEPEQHTFVRGLYRESSSV
jgi:flagellar biogenesis protein FliO